MATIDLGKVKIVWKGTWSSGTTYEVNDVVTSNGATWICTQGYTAVSGNRRAPGLRDRTNAYGVQFDPDKNPKDVFQLQKVLVSVPVGNKFFIDGRRNPGYTGTGNPITLYRGQTYRFQTYHSSMSGVDFRFCTSTDGTTYSTGVTVVGTPGISGSYVQITVAQDAPATLYYKQNGTANIADTSYFTIADTWEGFQYWEQICEGFTWRGTYSAATQYYRNDVVELHGAAWIAKADSIGKQPDMSMQSTVSATNAPTVRGFWMPFSESGAMRHPGHAAWLQNQGPIDWPYKHTSNQNATMYFNYNWISRSGRVYNIGPGTSNSKGLLPTYVDTYANEIQFYFTNWLRSRDNMPRYTTTKSATATGALTGDTFDYVQRKNAMFAPVYYGKNDLTSPHGQQPRCIQVDGGYDHYVYLFDNGEVHHGGYASNGNSGAGSTSTYTGMPLRVNNLEGVKIKKVLTGQSGTQDSTHHNMALDEDGRVWTWGYNAYGQCGTGSTANQYSAYQIPKEYFGNQRVIDICLSGNTYGSSYARTESNEIWAWGYNATGQLGLGDTTNRWRPNKITAFDPAANGGVIKIQGMSSSSGDSSFYVLDGAGYMWHAGYNGYGQGISADTTQHNTLVRSTQSPTAGTTTDFWACQPNGYGMIWMRTSNGNTYFCGYNASGNYHAGTGDNTNKNVPTLVLNVTNLKNVYCVCDYSTNLRTAWLTDNGQMWAQGYINYAWNNNSLAGGPSTIENGSNYAPYRQGLPGGTKMQQMFFTSDDNSTNVWGPYLVTLADNGQVFFSGCQNINYSYTKMGGHRQAPNSQNFMPVTKGR